MTIKAKGKMKMICSIEELQKYSGVYLDEEENNSQIMFIGSAQNIVENYLGYDIEQKDYSKVYNGLGYKDLRLGVKNITALNKIEIDGNIKTPASFYIDDDSIIYIYGEFPAGYKNIYVEFTAGYDKETIPELIKLTVLRIATLLQSESDSNIGITSKSFGDSGTRVFQNYTNFDKYLKPLSRYKLLA